MCSSRFTRPNYSNTQEGVSVMTIYNDNIARPYVYLITYNNSGEYYFGYRQANKNPAKFDIGLKYFTSSGLIKSRGLNNTTIEIINEFTEKDVSGTQSTPGDAAFDHEQELIWQHWDDPLCLNQSVKLPHENRSRFKSKKGKRSALCGGTWEDYYGLEKAKEMKLKASERTKKLANDPEYCKKLSDSLTGRKKSVEHRKNISLSRKGKAPWNKGKKGVQKGLFGSDNPMFGKTGRKSARFGKSPFENFTDERMRKYTENLSKRMLGKNNPMFNKHQTKETKEKIRKKALGRKNKNTDITIYTWIHPIYGIEKCCRFDLVQKYKDQKLHTRELGYVIKGKYHQHRGWTIQK